MAGVSEMPRCPYCGNTLLLSCVASGSREQLRRWICAGRFGCRTVWSSPDVTDPDRDPELTIVTA